MSLFKRKSESAGGRPGEWYYCIRHNKVEEGPECKATDRLGPYATQAEAAHALEKAEQRNEDWDRDPDWSDDEGDQRP
ncbi:hypothetical protein G5C51_38420 [Streptomyces sp. A7024]|uniref:SPOR domain-containing protein n=1 Tax=Streptomyces coryli TaxID=1128680 RepID=A0A6G4UEG9_9ACTN|nr:hypothetical protein [Streptomyces coryli]NGN69751.1 hypothetical protein [Streptomyces coryli]